jgi:hypothetical protein
MTTIHLGDCSTDCSTCINNYHSTLEGHECDLCGGVKCQDCGKYFNNVGCGCGFAVMKMTELTAELKARGLDAMFAMSGGNCGTIYIPRGEGRAEFAIGCGNYLDDEIFLGDTCWGLDDEGESEPTYYTGTPEDFTPAKVADLIAADYRKAVA